jgi:hypothetical protein
VLRGLPVEERKRAIRTRALRDGPMRRDADLISDEAGKMCEQLGDSGEVDLLEFFGELMTCTSTATLIGKEFRDDLAAKGAEFEGVVCPRNGSHPSARHHGRSIGSV